MQQQLLRLLSRLLLILLPVSFLFLPYIYLYPLINRCSFPKSDAPFRLLALADPQLEGNTAIYSRRYNASHPIIRTLRSWRKVLDLWGNDYYLAHIYRTLHDKAEFMLGVEPTHTTVLGDLIGSQWIFDDEFESRGRRYWDVVFKGASTAFPHGEEAAEAENKNLVVLKEKDDEFWKDKLINIVGNHDIGYAGEITEARMERFEKMYGKANFVFWYTLPERYIPASHKGSPPKLRIVNLNTLNIDGPAYDTKLQQQTYDFLHSSVFNPPEELDLTTTATILLTHVPLHKASGICVDAPMFNYYGHGTIREQNHVSEERSRMLLNEMFGKGKPIVNKALEKLEGSYRDSRQGGLILTGHDHEGCDVWHSYVGGEDGSAEDWKAEVYSPRKQMLSEPLNVPPSSAPGVREVTVRSMMGEFGGNAGLVSAWYDFDERTWKFEYSICPIGTQHYWWAAHIIAGITALLSLLYVSLLMLPSSSTLPHAPATPKMFPSTVQTVLPSEKNEVATVKDPAVPKLIVTEVEDESEGVEDGIDVDGRDARKRKIRKGKRSETLERDIMSDVVVISASEGERSHDEAGRRRKRGRRSSSRKA